jgi:two-component system, chemotaxis family, chemotaxis protein CheV
VKVYHSNYFELIEFTLRRKLPDGKVIEGVYGVNVAKVREVIRMPKLNPLGSSLSEIPGLFELRNVPIPAIHLTRLLGEEDAVINQDDQVLVVEFSNKRAGFIVSQAEKIRRVSWDQVLPPAADHQSCMTGMILMDNKDFLFILDMERILLNLEKKAGFVDEWTNVSSGPAIARPEQHAVTALEQNHSNRGKVLTVDDSRLILDGLKVSLSSAGFEVISAENGVQALKKLELLADGELAAIVTDMEMPQMDGISLIKAVRNQERFAQIPIVLHTSLSGKASISAGQEAGADAYVVKNDVQGLIKVLKQKITDRLRRSA